MSAHRFTRRNRSAARVLDSVSISGSWARSVHSGVVAVELIGNDSRRQFTDEIDRTVSDAGNDVAGRPHPVKSSSTSRSFGACEPLAVASKNMGP